MEISKPKPEFEKVNELGETQAIILPEVEPVEIVAEPAQPNIPVLEQPIISPSSEPVQENLSVVAEPKGILRDLLEAPADHVSAHDLQATVIQAAARAQEEASQSPTLPS